MGRDKASLPFGPQTMLERVVGLVSAAVEEVCVVAREGQAIEGSFRVARDPAEGLGPLAGIVAGLEAIEAERAFVTACDAPLLRPAFVLRMMALSQGFDLAMPEVDGHMMVTSAVYSKTVLPVARELIATGRLRPRVLIDRCNARILSAADFAQVDPDLESLLDCDTPADYRDLLQRAGLAFDPNDLPGVAVP